MSPSRRSFLAASVAAAIDRPVAVRDLWQRRPDGGATRRIERRIESHGGGLFRLKVA